MKILLSKTMRLDNTNYRLLITGTPLQEIKIRNADRTIIRTVTNSQLLKLDIDGGLFDVVLRSFLLRRLKSDVEKGLPPKKETILKVGMSQMQKHYYKALLQKDLEVVNAGTG
ncbi:putative chromatin-remodeling complex ATPase chain [Forsythia ovata]|uniref:Chromatin-remodeling complex ATPase chain n=1 Tax=Forsythia ovata TaxID=205694 RepID=A0ABD1X5Y2_9LAMI